MTTKRRIETPGASAAAEPVAEPAPVVVVGAERIAASETGGMTVAECMAKIDAGELQEPFTYYLCADGYYTRRQMPEG